MKPGSVSNNVANERNRPTRLLSYKSDKPAHSGNSKNWDVACQRGKHQGTWISTRVFGSHGKVSFLHFIDRFACLLQLFCRLSVTSSLLANTFPRCSLAGVRDIHLMDFSPTSKLIFNLVCSWVLS